ncbi:hypothetical protein POTOM_034874 [Populus tomentosa]|uniref:Protein kinase domain-containing protein n=1 Tax=Populus tomentosa TaxID=118781 RepID=A0A8X8CGG8_POPTO|nr:hypothetical protein POTOM_034874 [Populus tomentosa]
MSINMKWLRTQILKISSTLQKERRIFERFPGPNEVVECYGYCVSKEGGVLKYNILLEDAPMGSLLNLMRDCGGRIPESHIADFGLAKEPGEDDSDMLFHLYQHRGTPCYMSPESVQFAEITVSALDIWSLGCIVVEMITGRVAWGNLDSKELFNKLVCGNESPKIPEYMSESGKDFPRRCFELDHRERWTADTLLTHPFVDDEPLQPVEPYIEELLSPCFACAVNSVLCEN